MAYALRALPALATLLVLAPIVEETLFRQGVQECLRRHIGPGSTVAATALLFAAAHTLTAPGLPALATVVPALAIGLVYEATRRLAPCIALHAAANAAWLAMA